MVRFIYHHFGVTGRDRFFLLANVNERMLAERLSDVAGVEPASSRFNRSEALARHAFSSFLYRLGYTPASLSANFSASMVADRGFEPRP